MMIMINSHSSVTIFLNIFNKLEFVMDNPCVFVRYIYTYIYIYIYIFKVHATKLYRGTRGIAPHILKLCIQK